MKINKRGVEKKVTAKINKRGGWKQRVLVGFFSKNWTQASRTFLFLAVLLIFYNSCQISILKTKKLGSIANSWTVPHQFRPWEALDDLRGIRDGHKMWGTVRELDIEPHF